MSSTCVLAWNMRPEDDEDKEELISTRNIFYILESLKKIAKKNSTVQENKIKISGYVYEDRYLILLAGDVESKPGPDT